MVKGRLAFILPFVFSLGMLCSPSDVVAGPIGLSVSAHGHHGISINNLENSPTFYGWGFGFRGGYTAPFKLYVGLLADYYLGSSEEVVVPMVATAELSGSAFHGALEVGYELDLISLKIVPSVGFGLISFEGESGVDFGAISATASGRGESFVLSPGVSANIGLGPLFYLNGDFRFLIPTENLEDNEKSFTIGVGVGARF